MKDKKGFKILNFIMKLISWCIMAILIVIGVLLVTIVVLNKIADSKGELSPMGLYTIISPSMTPDIQVYDVVFVMKKDPEDIEIGDIVSYYSTNAVFNEIPITHRVVEKFNTNNGISFRTKGDANQVVDNEIVMSERVIGTVRFVIPLLGRIQFFLASKSGWFIAILIPALGIIIYDIVKVCKLISVKKKMERPKGKETGKLSKNNNKEKFFSRTSYKENEEKPKYESRRYSSNPYKEDRYNESKYTTNRYKETYQTREEKKEYTRPKYRELDDYELHQNKRSQLESYDKKTLQTKMTDEDIDDFLDSLMSNRNKK